MALCFFSIYHDDFRDVLFRKGSRFCFCVFKKGGFSSETITSSEMPRLPHISATELSAQKYMTAVMSGRRQISGKNSVRMKQALLLTAVQSEESNYLAISARMRPCVSADSRNVNIRYIHQQDGEKG